MGESEVQALEEQLAREDTVFRRLMQEHRRLDEAVKALDSRRYLTPEEEMERKRLQKQKLYTKDQMAAMLRRYQQKQMAMKH